MRLAEADGQAAVPCNLSEHHRSLADKPVLAFDTQQTHLHSNYEVVFELVF